MRLACLIECDSALGLSRAEPNVGPERRVDDSGGVRIEDGLPQALNVGEPRDGLPGLWVRDIQRGFEGIIALGLVLNRCRHG